MNTLIMIILINEDATLIVKDNGADVAVVIVVDTDDVIIR